MEKTDWKTALVNAVGRLCTRERSYTFTRQMLIDAELPHIIADTGSTGRTPAQTLSRVLQELRDMGYIEFIDSAGTYRLLAEQEGASGLDKGQGRLRLRT